MTPIKFGTDGWRAIIAKEFTVENVARVTEATVQWLKDNTNGTSSVIIGHDCRFAGEMFAKTAAIVFAKGGVQVKLASGFVSTPMVSLGTCKENADLGIVITASHNPPAYNGYKIKGSYGGPLLPEKVQEIEDLIPNSSDFKYDEEEFKALQAKGLIQDIDLEGMYIAAVEENFDLDAIRNSGLKFAYDAMYGAGQNVIRKILPDAVLLHCEDNPGFMGQAPEPIHKNLLEFSDLIKNSGDIAAGLATDGDADRIGLYNSKGEFVDSHHIILLLIKYLVEQKKMTGKVVTAFSASVKVKQLCDHFGLEHETVKIGFKYICSHMISEDVLLGGEESGGIAIKGHVPERDGIWMGLVIWEYMAKSGKSLEQLIDEVYAIVGKFAFQRNDLHLTESVKQSIIERCKKDEFKSFGSMSVADIQKIDGFKYFFNEDEWVMIRPSGTEPVLRTYAEAETLQKAEDILNACKQEILD
ncbi:phosphoglucomutase/phosphomannomutase family protein [Luteibaculum oceani]|uniref:Phosphoglucomutase/phosphomannomutase family protein n=1 Tax=Luteibaculum oceani TaxID=1294296 RepID=A0A5C6V8M4_9FLAO|nr:phosphoglucomutase/phosphomannomutase family protein [Luteibaculum oceani]TXC81377.1 phosphoglucomutase/phosphomannomutase family protein [Luteibaculum oceani]